MATQNTPIWLDLKTEYIDANLSKVISYLSKEFKNPGADSFFWQTEELLRRRVSEIVKDLSTTPIGDNNEGFEKKTLLTLLKELGAFVLIQMDKSPETAREALFYFLQLLIQVLPDKYTEDLCEIALNCITKSNILQVGFNWEDLQSEHFSERLEIIANKFLNIPVFKSELVPTAWYQGKGSLKLEKGALELFEKNKDDSLLRKPAASLCILDDTIKVQTESSDKIIQSESDNLTAMNTFTARFVQEQLNTTPSPDKSLKKYNQGETMIVKYTGLDTVSNLMVETMEGDHEKIKGILKDYKKQYIAANAAERGKLQNRLIKAYNEVGVSSAEAMEIMQKWVLDANKSSK